MLMMPYASDLADGHLAFVGRGQFFYDGGYHAAGTAPFRPEIDYHRLVGGQVVFQVVVCKCQSHNMIDNW